MPDVIDDDDNDALAAEFVLGTLDADERTHANLLLDIDDSFRGKVRVWERRLGELHLMVEPVEPAPQIWERIEAKVEGVSPRLAAAPETTPASTPTTPPSQPETPPPAEAAAAEEGTVAVEDKPAAEKTKEPLGATLDEIEAELRKMGAVGSAPTELSARPLEMFPDRAAAAPEVEAVADETAKEPTIHQADVVARDRQAGRERDRSNAYVAPGAAGSELKPALRRWRAVAVLMGILVVAIGALLAAWRYAPNRLPAPLRATAVLHINIPPAAPQKPKAPPESVFDE